MINREREINIAIEMAIAAGALPPTPDEIDRRMEEIALQQALKILEDDPERFKNPDEFAGSNEQKMGIFE